MWRALAIVFALSLPGQTELRLPPPNLQFPAWADPEPREIPSGLILDRVDYENCEVRETPFSIAALAAILSNTLPGK